MFQLSPLVQCRHNVPVPILSGFFYLVSFVLKFINKALTSFVDVLIYSTPVIVS